MITVGQYGMLTNAHGVNERCIVQCTKYYEAHIIWNIFWRGHEKFHSGFHEIILVDVCGAQPQGHI